MGQNLRWTEDEYRAYCLRRHNEQQQRAAVKAGSEVSSAVVERRALKDPLGPTHPKAKDTGKYLVRVVSYRTRLLDEDNLCAKFHVDALRYAGLIPTDAPTQTQIQVSQIKVPSRTECCTEITIERITT